MVCQSVRTLLLGKSVCSLKARAISLSTLHPATMGGHHSSSSSTYLKCPSVYLVNFYRRFPLEKREAKAGERVSSDKCQDRRAGLSPRTNARTGVGLGVNESAAQRLRRPYRGKFSAANNNMDSPHGPLLAPQILLLKKIMLSTSNYMSFQISRPKRILHRS
jgi:hypothetical protein